MVDPTTANTSMSVPIRGTDTGTWDTPVNGNFTSLDAMMGSVTSVALTSAAVTLTTSQALVNIIRFTGTLTANVAVTLPGIYKSWTVDNQVVNSPSSFAVSLVSTSGTSIVGCPPGPQDIFYDGTSVKYSNMGRIGEYWDYAASAVPTWVTVSTVPPYLNCDGTVFSSATYPILTNLLGTTTRPDARGRSRFTYGAATGRLTTAGAGIDGTTVLAAGGNNGISLGSSHVPTITSLNSTQGISVFAAGSSLNIVPYAAGNWANLSAGAGANNVPQSNANGSIFSAGTFSGTNSISATFTNSSQAIVQATVPGYVGGITMIRAA